MRKKADHKRIEQLEAFARRLKIEDAKKRHLESISKLSDEEFAVSGVTVVFRRRMR